MKTIQDETHLLFDSSYWDDQDIFACNKIRRGNEKYIRDYTLCEEYKEGNVTYMGYKQGGLVVEKDRCWYQEGFIRPSDVLCYRESVSDIEGKEINFNDLIICAITHGVLGRGATNKYFSILFRSVITGEFYSISYEYLTMYIAEEYMCEDSLLYFAYKVDFTEQELLEMSEENDDMALYNTQDFLSRRRKYKIRTAFSE
ncbi:hypothetical protein ACFS7Z_08640 [Pontibacter toksunensis]|uniref:Uncharacterized protein n=1 Tax=Pontibacter toksunensis TaxID=1332631 RepID=A0ABW6BWM2_9BACT